MAARSFPTTTSDTSLVFDRNKENIESHQLIWLDAYINSNEGTTTMNQLRTIIDYVKIVSNVKQCEQYIKQTSDIMTFFITSGQLGKQIVPLIHGCHHIRTIYIYCQDREYHRQWASAYTKVRGIHVKLEELLENLTQDVKDYLKHEQDEIFVLTNKNDRTTNMFAVNWWGDLIRLLVGLHHPKIYQQKVIRALELYYSGNTHETNILKEFEETYTSDRAVWWYTRQTFLFRLLNKSLRQRNVRVLFMFGFFIKDLYQQLKQEHDNYIHQQKHEHRSIKVYRGQIISKDELQELTDIPVQINSFLSTSIYRSVALEFLQPSSPDAEIQSILLEIEIDWNCTSQPFADITHLSYFPNEKEILFMITTEFTVECEPSSRKHLVYDENEKVWAVKLRLRDETVRKYEVHASSSRINLKRQIGEKTVYLIHATSDEINIVFTNLLILYPSEKWILAIKNFCLARHERWGKRYNQAFQHYKHALQIWFEHISDNSLGCEMNIGDVFSSMSFCYTELNNKDLFTKNVDLGISYYDKVIEKAEISNDRDEQMSIIKIDKVYHEYISLYIRKTNMADDINDKLKYRKVATSYREKELRLMLKCLPSNDTTIGWCYNHLGDDYAKNSDYDNALKNYQKGLEVYLMETKPNPVYIIIISEKMSAIYSEKKHDYRWALKYYLTTHKYIVLKNTPTDSDGQRQRVAASYEKLAHIYEILEEYDLAEQHLSLAIKLEIFSRTKKQQIDEQLKNIQGKIFERLSDQNNSSLYDRTVL